MGGSCDVLSLFEVRVRPCDVCSSHLAHAPMCRTLKVETNKLQPSHVLVSFRNYLLKLNASNLDEIQRVAWQPTSDDRDVCRSRVDRAVSA